MMMLMIMINMIVKKMMKMIAKMSSGYSHGLTSESQSDLSGGVKYSPAFKNNILTDIT